MKEQESDYEQLYWDLLYKYKQIKLENDALRQLIKPTKQNNIKLLILKTINELKENKDVKV